MPVTPTDEELLMRAQSGSGESLGLLVVRWEQPLFRFSYRILEKTEDARDVCQETFLRILKKADRFEEGARFSTWMYQIALNLCRDHLRRRKRWRLVDQPEEASERAARIGGSPARFAADSPEQALEERERREIVARALRSLSPEQREVLVLKEFEGLKFREIAEIIGCPESTVKSRMYGGLSALREVLVRSGVHSP